ncbi:MAG: hypothetical protein CMH57_02305 [Myxococcales bacterium]|nr:hypothetical protein [Myxococcales bacterium]
MFNQQRPSRPFASQPGQLRRSLGFLFGAAIVVGGLMVVDRSPSAEEGEAPQLPECADRPAASRLYTQLRERHVGMRQEELQLQRESEVLDTRRAELVKQLEELRALRVEVDRRLDAWEKKADSARQQRVAHLVAVLAEVPAPSAARILVELEQELAVDVLRSGDKSRAGEILSALPTDKAAVFASALAADVKGR